MTIHQGSCHCGGIAVELSTDIAPADTRLRECQCSFCRMHQALAISDPAGQVIVRERTSGHLHRYRFGLATADFIVCANCGAYAGAVLEAEGHSVGIVNARLLNGRKAFTSTPVPMDYSAEGEGGRIARRLEKWMPMRVEEMDR